MKSANTVWLENLINIDNNGKNVSPRQLGSKEIISYSSTVSMSKPVVSILKRRLSFQFMAAEALWILEGDNRVIPLSEYAPSIVKFSDDGEVFYGAYRPQLESQLDYIIDKFLEDIDTRQAVASIWIRNPKKSLDIPCTVSVQWVIRDRKLHCIDTMRSSDLWLGWPYDIFNFTMLTTLIGLRLKEHGVVVELGNITIQAGSQHLYIQNLESARECLSDGSFADYTPLNLNLFKSTQHLKDTLTKIKSSSNCNNYWLSELK